MGSLVHIAEVAVLLLLAYSIGWAGGYFARMLTSRAQAPASAADVGATAPAGASAAAAGTTPASVASTPAAPSGTDVVAAASGAASAPASTAQPDGLLVQAQATPAASVPVSGIESLKSLSSDMPLVPVTEAASAGGVATTETAQGDAAGVAQPRPGDEGAAEPAPLTGAAADEVVRATDQPDGTVVVAPPAAPAREADEIEAQPEAVTELNAANEATILASTARPASVAGMPWSGALHGRAPERFVPPEPAAPPLSESLVAGAGTGRAAPAPPDTLPPADALVLAAATDMGSSEPTPGETEEPAENREPAGLDVAVLARIADALQPAATTAVVPAAVEGLGAAESLPQPNAQPAAVDTSSPNPVIPADVAPEPQPAARAAPEPEATAPEPAAAVRQPASEREFDEDAAMRAIEGGWSRRDARALPDAPELTDVTAAVSAAQVAVEQVLARSGIAPAEAREHAAFGKPRGLPHARNGLRDDLKQIAGLGPLDESALNNLGIYHFDQIAGWDEREVLWLENHAFARGRIGREQWQAQARALASGAAEPRARR